MNYRKRLEKVQHILKTSHCDAFIVDDPINLYYLTGIPMSSGKIVVNTDEAFLLVDNRYYELCKKLSFLTVFLSETTPLEKVLNRVSNLGFDGETMTYQSYKNLEKLLKHTTLVSLNNPIQKIRSIKEPEEIEILKEAASLGVEGYRYLESLLRDGITEIEMATELEIFWKRKGGQGVAFEPIIAFGEMSAIPHYRASDTLLKKGMTVLIDIGVKWKRYHSDMTRTLFWGEPVPLMREIYEIVDEAKKRALEICKPGTLIGDLDSEAREFIASKGYGDNFLHSLGHGVGLEIHEWPLIRKKEPYQNLTLEEGMVITIEPGIYLPGIGGVRLEDTVVITSNGHINLCQ